MPRMTHPNMQCEAPTTSPYRLPESNECKFEAFRLSKAKAGGWGLADMIVCPPFPCAMPTLIHPPATSTKARISRHQVSTRHTFSPPDFAVHPVSDVAKPIFIFAVNSNSHPP